MGLAVPGRLCLHPQTVVRLLSDSPCQATDGHGRHSLVLTFYLAFSWSAVVQRGIRYLLPIFPIIFLMLADILVFYAVRFVHRWWPPRGWNA